MVTLVNVLKLFADSIFFLYLCPQKRKTGSCRFDRDTHQIKSKTELLLLPMAGHIPKGKLKGRWITKAEDAQIL